MAEKYKIKETPLIDELTKGPWPSFIKEFKTLQEKKEVVNDLMGQLERSYETKIGYWKHGGIVGVMGYGGGVIGRYSALADDFPAAKHFHTMRINQPPGWFYTTDALRKLCDIWDEHGSGITNMHGSTGDIVFLGTTTDELEPTFEALTEAGFDLGGSGSNLRTPSCCCGQARCEWACYDTMGLCYDLTQEYQDELHRPQFPYKFKFKMAGCPNDCVASIARSDLSIIGTWKDDIQIDAEAVKEYAKNGDMDIMRDVVMNCPTKCMDYDNEKITIDNSNCVRCMHCINALPKALAPGKERGATLLLGAKAPIIEGAMLSSVLVPFIELEPPYEDLKEVIEAIWEPWAEYGKNRERVGEFIERVGKGNFLEEIGLDPIPEMVKHPRENPYIFYDLEEEAEGITGEEG